MTIGKITPSKNISSPSFPYMQKRSNNMSIEVGNRLTDCKYQYGSTKVQSKNAYMVFRWTLPKSVKAVKTIKKIQLSGTWTIYDATAVQKVVNNDFEEVHNVSK